MKPIFRRSIFSAALIAVLAGPALGEVFILNNGGRVEGELLNADQSPRKDYLVRIRSGAEVTIPAAQVKKKLFQNPQEIEYEKVRPKYPDTVEGQWELARWCQARHLIAQRRTHLRRVIELSPDHEDARHALGYSQFDGKWMTQKEVKLSRGERFYKGRWRLPQEIELMKRKQQKETSEREWFGKIRMWRGWLDSSNKRDSGHKNLMAIADPQAVKALAGGLKNDKNLKVRMLYIEILAKIGSPEAIQELAAASMESRIVEIRLTCLDFLEKEKRPNVVDYFVGRLKSKDNVMVRRAAIGLSYMDDPSAIGPLINALITIHKYKIVKGSGNPNQQTHTFGNAPGGGGFGFGGGGTKTIKVPKRNQEVLEALISLTDGVNYQFNVEAWKSWYAAQKKGAIGAARRD